MTNLFYIHSLGEEISGSIPTSSGLHIGGDFDDVKSILKSDPLKSTQIRFFIGYSGWDKEQLNEEMSQKSWIVLNDLSKEQILDCSNDDIWTKTMKKQGEKFKVMTNFPVNPSDN